MKQDEDPFDILGISHDASEADIKKAYRKLARKYHPDKQTTVDGTENEDATAMFAKIAEAYETLTDPVKRYDYRMSQESQAPPKPPSRPPSTTYSSPQSPSARKSAQTMKKRNIPPSPGSPNFNGHVKKRQSMRAPSATSTRNMRPPVRMGGAPVSPSAGARRRMEAPFSTNRSKRPSLRRQEGKAPQMKSSRHVTDYNDVRHPAKGRKSPGTIPKKHPKNAPPPPRKHLLDKIGDWRKSFKMKKSLSEPQLKDTAKTSKPKETRMNSRDERAKSMDRKSSRDLRNREKGKTRNKHGEVERSKRASWLVETNTEEKPRSRRSGGDRNKSRRSIAGHQSLKKPSSQAKTKTRRPMRHSIAVQ